MFAGLSLQCRHLAGELVDQVHQGEDERPQLVVLGAVVAGQDLGDEGVELFGHIPRSTARRALSGGFARGPREILSGWADGDLNSYVVKVAPIISHGCPLLQP